MSLILQYYPYLHNIPTYYRVEGKWWGRGERVRISSTYNNYRKIFLLLLMAKSGSFPTPQYRENAGYWVFRRISFKINNLPVGFSVGECGKVWEN
jgi:hypothetical protein